METCRSVKCERAREVIEIFAFILSVIAAVAILAVACGMIASIVMSSIKIFPLIVHDGFVPQVYKIVISVLNVVILLELMELFLRFEAKHRVSMKLVMDTAITFGIRELIISLYSGKTGSIWYESPIAIVICLVALRIFLEKERQANGKYGE